MRLLRGFTSANSGGQAVGDRCYANPYYQLHFLDGSDWYNFLDYTRTELLARNLNRLREVIGSDKLNI